MAALNRGTLEQNQPGWRNLPVEVVNERGLRHLVPPKIQLGAADYAAQNGVQATNQPTLRCRAVSALGILHTSSFLGRSIVAAACPHH
jgi:hypothetical protein